MIGPVGLESPSFELIEGPTLHQLEMWQSDTGHIMMIELVHTVGMELLQISFVSAVSRMCEAVVKNF